MTTVDSSFDELSVALSYAFLSAPSAAAKLPGTSVKQSTKAAAVVADFETPIEDVVAAAPSEDFDDMFGGEEKKPAVKEGGDDDFSFDYGDGDDEEEDAEAAAASKARRERIALAAKMKKEKDEADGKVKKDKEKPAEKSLVVLEVKPWEADTDLEALWKEIRKYEQEGLVWGESFKLEPVAYGIMKLVMTCTIVDALVLMDDVTDAIEKLEDFVQSVQVASMNKV